MNDINYQRVINLAKSYGDPRVIELNQVRALMNALQRVALAPAEIKEGFLVANRLKTPFGQFYDAYEQLVRKNRKFYFTFNSMQVKKWRSTCLLFYERIYIRRRHAGQVKGVICWFRLWRS